MTAIEEIDNRRKKCPVCGTLVDELGLAKAGLTKEEIQILTRHKNNGTIGHLIHLVDILMPKRNGDQMMTEADWKLAISELKNAATEVRGDVAELMKRLAGTAVGKVGESITTKALKSLCQSDEFSTEKAATGTDIVAIVKENGELFGNIAISVKYDVRWSRQFVIQLRKNMKQEGTPFGLLVTKVFPADSLNDKAYVMENKNGEMLLLVKPEYAEVAYYGFRHAAIAWKKANAIISDIKEKIQERQKITKAVIDWISGPGFKMAAEKIDNAIEFSNETNKEVEHLRSYVDRKATSIQQIQEDLRSDLLIAKSALQHLKDMLEGKKEEEK